MRSITKKIMCIVICVACVIGFMPFVTGETDVYASDFFSDVTNSNDFWFTPVYWGAANNIVYGYSDGTFKPANQCTRAQMVTFIWRIAGKPEPKSSKSPFSDINKSDYWYKAALWGNENHIVEGYSDGSFKPQNLCTRKQAVTFLWRFAGKPEPKSKTCKFSDVKKSDYFYTAVIWANEVGIVAGYNDGTFKPSGDCLRRQMVTFLYKFSNLALKGKIKPISLSKTLTSDTDIDYDAIDKANKPTPTPKPTTKPTPTPKPSKGSYDSKSGLNLTNSKKDATFLVNISSKKYHIIDGCRYSHSTSDNLRYTTDSEKTLKAKGYVRCSYCW